MKRLTKAIYLEAAIRGNAQKTTHYKMAKDFLLSASAEDPGLARGAPCTVLVQPSWRFLEKNIFKIDAQGIS